MAYVPVVSDKMRYGLKPIAVESKNHILTVPCIGTNIYPGNTSSTIVFRIQHNPSGRYVDPTATRIKVTFTLNIPTELRYDCHSFFFERGPESIIRRLTITDIQGRILEDIDQYNMVYAITEICTNDSDTRLRRGTMHMEGQYPNESLGGWIKHPTFGLQNGLSDQTKYTFDLTFTPFSAVFGGASEKYIPLSVMEGMEVRLQLENPQGAIKYAFLPGESSNTGFNNGQAWEKNTFLDNTACPKTAHYWHTHRARTNEGNANGMVGLITGINVGGAPDQFVRWSNAYSMARDRYANDDDDTGVYQYELQDPSRSQVTYELLDPKLLISCLDVEPAVNAQLVNAAKDPRDGMIRIQTFSWGTYSTQISAGYGGLYSWTIPVSVTSMKSIFFTLTDQFTRENINYMKTGFEHRGLLRYRILIGGLPLNADWVEVSTKGDTTVYNTHSEAVSTLMEAWSVHQKTENSPTLICRENYAPAQWSHKDLGFYMREYNAVFGHELESFSQKSGIIQSGLNTMQTTFVLELEFMDTNVKKMKIGAPLAAGWDGDGGAAFAGEEDCILFAKKHAYELRAYVMYDKVIAFDETSGSIRAEY